MQATYICLHPATPIPGGIDGVQARTTAVMEQDGVLWRWDQRPPLLDSCVLGTVHARIGAVGALGYLLL